MTERPKVTRLAFVNDEETRGQAIQRRRSALGIESYREWVEEIDIDRDTLSKAERGEASDRTYKKIEAWLDDKEVEMSMDKPSPDADQITIEVYGVYGAARVVVKGPSAKLPEMEQTVERLLRRHPEE